MLATTIIVFREVLEAALIVGIVLAASKGVAGRSVWVGAGVACGVLAAGAVALFAGALSELAQGMGQELFNACILFAAVLMLSWHVVWMGRHGREMAREVGAVGRAVAGGARPLYVLAVVVGIAVLREGSEVVLFLYGIAAQGDTGALAQLAGGALGLAAGIAVGGAMYFGLLTIPQRHLFSATNGLIVLLAAGMAAQAADFLVQADVLPALGQQVWDTSWLLSDKSIFGRVLHTLIGYVDRPSGIQLTVYFATIAIIATLSKLAGHAPQNRAARPSPAE
ncbi:MAG TPA: FTR1 family protein [Candidatus Cybelea sp.]|nr:FTR1 family protein [Candidatus Cybelea sp.]